VGNAFRALNIKAEWGRHRLRDAREVGRRQRHVERAERFAELIAAARTDQWHDVLAARADPSEGELRGRDVLPACNHPERIHERHVTRKVLVREARHAPAGHTYMLRRRRAVAEEATREHAVGDERDPQLAERWQDFLLDAAA